MYHSARPGLSISEDFDKENIAPAGYVVNTSKSRGLPLKKGLAPSSRPLAEIEPNTLTNTSTITSVRLKFLNIYHLAFYLPNLPRHVAPKLTTFGCPSQHTSNTDHHFLCF